jgi:DNA-binding GntR family transcriptional regulator
VMGDLLSRSSLVSLMMQSAHSAEESHAEHVAIVEALARRDARTAIKLMNGHLGSVERNLRLNPRSGDLAEALQPTTKRRQA